MHRQEGCARPQGPKARAYTHLHTQPGSSRSAALQAGTARRTGPTAVRSAHWGQQMCSRWLAGQVMARGAGERARGGGQVAATAVAAGAGGAAARAAATVVATLAGMAMQRQCRCSCSKFQGGCAWAGLSAGTATSADAPTCRGLLVWSTPTAAGKLPKLLPAPSFSHPSLAHMIPNSRTFPSTTPGQASVNTSDEPYTRHACSPMQLAATTLQQHVAAAQRSAHA